jgi:hypothetical protein
MSTETESLLTESLEALVASQPFIPDLAGIEARGRPLRRRAYTVRALASAGFAAAVIAAALARDGWVALGVRPSTTAGAAPGGDGSAILYRLASVSDTVPPLQGRYVALSEIDTNSRVAGETQRTSVIDTKTGASTTYQHTTGNAQASGTVHIGYAGPQPVVTEGPDPTSTEA